MAYKLLKPCTEKQKNEFVSNYITEMGLAYAECPEFIAALEEWEILQNDEIIGDKQTWQKETRRAEILARLEEIDLKSIRALRANDTEYITAYETEAVELREELRELEN